MKPTKDTLFHEAGHAIACLAFGSPFDAIRLCADGPGRGRLAVHGSNHTIEYLETEGGEAETEAGRAQEIWDLAVTALAGPIAGAKRSHRNFAHEYCFALSLFPLQLSYSAPESAWPGWLWPIRADDTVKVAVALRLAGKDTAKGFWQLEHDTRKLVNRRWREITVVAEALGNARGCSLTCERICRLLKVESCLFGVDAFTGEPRLWSWFRQEATP